PFERAAYDAHPPASPRIRMRLSPEPRSHHIPQGLNLLIRKRARQTSETHDAGHARNLEHAQTFFYRNPHEDVACEQRNIEPPSAVCPFPHRFIQRKKMLDSPQTELLGDAFLVVRAGVGRIPTPFQ